MTDDINKKEYTIDATNKKLGRVASEAAKFLMGKNLTSFSRNIIPKSKVIITNASKIYITAKKQESKVYKTYSGYPGGLKKETMKSLASRKGYSEIFKKAIYGMIPANKLRSKIMKNLTVEK